MKLLFITTYHYPGTPAQFKHGLVMAREYANSLKEHFLYLVWFVNDRNLLAAIPYKEMNAKQWRLRQKRLMTAYLALYLPYFFLRYSRWRGRDVVVVTQESKVALLLILFRPFFGYRVVYECHGLHSPLTDRLVCRHSNAVVFVTERSRNEARLLYGTAGRDACIPNGFDAKDFQSIRGADLHELRARLRLPQGKILVGYIGRFKALGQDKGIAAGIKAASSIGDDRVMLCFVGGTKREIAHWQKVAEEYGVHSRVHFVPFTQDPSLVAAFTHAMDILIYTPPATKFFMEETSPMKLYEYMAAERPIIVSDFPAMREMLDDSSAFFIADQEMLAECIGYVIAHPQEARQKVSVALSRVDGNTWARRAQQMTTFFDASRPR